MLTDTYLFLVNFLKENYILLTFFTFIRVFFQGRTVNQLNTRPFFVIPFFSCFLWNL